MGLIVNLSTTHDYSINEIISAFVKLCNQYSQGCLQCMPGFFQTGTNTGWVTFKYKWHYKSLIEPYRLGKIETPEFLDNIGEILYFMKDLPREERNHLFISAWNASIKMEHTQDRLRELVERAETEKVYLISNTNELNVQAILALFKKEYPDLKFAEEIDISIKDSHEPVEILPNIYLCLSYRFQTFKSENVTTTVSILEELVTTNPDEEFTVVSQYSGDLNKAKELGISDIQKAEEFYSSERSSLSIKKDN